LQSAPDGGLRRGDAPLDRTTRSRIADRRARRGAGGAAGQPGRDERSAGGGGSPPAARNARHHRVGAGTVSRARGQRAALLRAHHRTPARHAGPDALMVDRAAKAFFHLLAQSPALKKAASRYGLQRPTSVARRFIAGETVADAIDAARAL